jgi:hypothetical protein
MSSISGGSSHSNHYFSRTRHLNQNNQASDATASADASDTTQADAINPDATLPELISMYDQVTQKIQSNDYAPPLSPNNAMGMGRMGLGRLIPFGMARRSAADLPDGNPWKNILGDRDNAAADAAQPQNQKEDDVALQQDLLTMILSRISGMMSADGTATDTSQSTIAVGDTTTTSDTTAATDAAVDTSVDTTTDTTETADAAAKAETVAATTEDTSG